MKLSLTLLFVVTFLLFNGGCNRFTRSGRENHSADRLKFIFITCVVNEDFFKPVIKGMGDAARMMDVECTFTGTVGVDVVEQAEMVRKAIRDGYHGIALNIIDPLAFDDVALEAAEAGIPLVAFNVDDHDTPNARLASVNQQLYEAGLTLGREVAKQIQDDSHILMTMHAAGVSALNDRLRGVQDALGDSGLKNLSWKVIITGNTAVESSRVIANELEADSTIGWVLCTGQADTEGAVLAISDGFAHRGCQAAGFDLTPTILKGIQQGHLFFTIDQQPYMQGFYPVIQLALLIRYGIKPSSIDAGASLVTKENVGFITELTQQGYR